VDQLPSYMPDGSILFGRQGETDGQYQIWRMKESDESPIHLPGVYARSPVVSKSGRYMACRILDQHQASGRWLVAVVDLTNLTILGTYPRIPFGAQIKWSPDESALTYVKDSNGVSNIWKTSIANRSEEAVTHFEEETIFSFDWSPKSDDLAMVRGIPASDVILIRRSQ